MIISLFYLLNVFIGLGIIIATYLWPEYQLLAKASIENGPYEIATAAILLLGGLWLLVRAWQIPSTDKTLKLFSFLMGLICLLGAGEEISWGQHWLKHESDAFFQQHNYQGETNLHNLMDPVWFSTAINVVIYGLFTLLPIIHWAFPKNVLSKKLKRANLDRFIPSLTIAILLLLANCFHAWLIPATYSDTGVLIACWALATWFVFRRPRSRFAGLNISALLLCLVAFAICTWAAEIFRHANLQYEIRECFTAYLIVFWALGWSNSVVSMRN